MFAARRPESPVGVAGRGEADAQKIGFTVALGAFQMGYYVGVR
jgi:hypothetical protein